MSELARANRVSIVVTSENTVARLWRTHKQIAEISTTQAIAQGYVVDDSVNATAQRELFRAWICNNAESFSVKYDPSDNRDDSNRFPSKYTSDSMLTEWAMKIVESDIREWASKMSTEYKQDIILAGATVDEIRPVYTSKSGKVVADKYANGNWAYAMVPVCMTFETAGQQGYVTVDVELVSGQLKKPSSIGDLGFTYTGMKTELLKDIQKYLSTKEDTSKKATSKKSKSTSKKGSKKDKVSEEEGLNKIEGIIEG